jgi:membrane-bound lytic murein transglycosylase B
MRVFLLSLLLATPALADPALNGETPADAAMGGHMAYTGTEAGFQDWLTAFRPRALAAGIAPATLDAVDALRFDPAVVDKDRNQSEFTKPIWTYLDSAASDDRIAAGVKALERNRALFDRLEAAFGVDREVVAAIWGLESAYGTFRGDIPTLQALASLAYDGRRGAFFEAQLIEALKIVQDRHITAAQMRGSWAGAMGHTQFMPSSFWTFAVDFDGDGRRDIWGDDPTDALASAAAYLSKSGWTKGMPWGVEITLPDGFDYAQTSERVKKPVAEWQAMGVRLADGGALPDHGLASVLLPAGHRGAAFLIFANFQVIETYNKADAYVIGVGHLADRLRGGSPIRATWPREDRALTRDERVELQRLLTAAGFDAGGVDGLMGPKTIAAVKAWQMAQGLVPDGYANPALLERLR